MDILRKDKDFDNFVKDLMEHYDNLFDAIKIQQVEKISKSGEKFDILKENLTDGLQQVSMYHRYIYTDLNSNLTTLRQAIENSTCRKSMLDKFTIRFLPRYLNGLWQKKPTDQRKNY